MLNESGKNIEENLIHFGFSLVFVKLVVIDFSDLLFSCQVEINQ